MAIGAYTNPDWANGGTPAINSANLQAATDQIKNITDAAVSGGASPTKIWTSTNDGNGGQPPAPKPLTGATTNIGAWRAFGSRYAGGSSTGIPGTWAVFWWASSFQIQDAVVVAGSTDLGASCIGHVAWRLA
jgi:hypothetical protein